MTGFYRQVVEVLQQYGFSLKRSGKGSHEQWSNGRVSVTVSRTCASRHTANAIMRQARIDHHF